MIGLTITQPIIALPLAFISHFLLDALPHVGLDEFGGHHKAKAKFRAILLLDSLALVGVFILLIILKAPLLAFACLIMAGSPDFIWAYRYIFHEKGGNKAPRRMNFFNRFHSRIQTSQTLKGAYVEVPIAIVFVLLIINQT